MITTKGTLADSMKRQELWFPKEHGRELRDYVCQHLDFIDEIEVYSLFIPSGGKQTMKHINS